MIFIISILFLFGIYSCYLVYSLKKTYFFREKGLLEQLKKQVDRQIVQGWRFIMMGIGGFFWLWLFQVGAPQEVFPRSFNDILINCTITCSILLVLMGMLHIIIYRQVRRRYFNEWYYKP